MGLFYLNSYWSFFLTQKDKFMSPGNFYHIYHHANGKENLFIENRNYEFFVEKFIKYPLPFLKVHAYCIMPNHFHFLIYVKDYDEIRFLEDFQVFKNLAEEKLQPLIEKKISKSFANRKKQVKNNPNVPT